MENYQDMKRISLKTAINEGGREGVSYNQNKSFLVKTSAVDSPDTVTPEMLFAAGYAACFNSAMHAPLAADGKDQLERSVRAEVSLYKGGDHDYQLAVNLIGHIEGLSKDETLAFMKLGEDICPYAKATKGNIKTTLEAE